MRGARARVQAGGRAHIKHKRVAPRLEAALFYRTSALSSNVQRRSPARTRLGRGATSHSCLQPRHPIVATYSWSSAPVASTGLGQPL